MRSADDTASHLATAADEPRRTDGSAPELELRGISKEYRTRTSSTVALQNINLVVGKGELVSVVGRSGCGKTTLLRILSGLLAPTEGEVLAAGRPLWNDGRRDAATAEKLGVVFQEANLFPWFSVEENIALPLQLRGHRKRERLARAHELCELVGIAGFETSLPRELSGGMRQRAAIARALSYNPEILLMDEPFGALDAMTRDKMNLELQAIAQTTGAMIVFVTHSIIEAVFLADRVVLLSPRPGRIRSITSISFARPRAMDVQSDPIFQRHISTLREQLEE